MGVFNVELIKKALNLAEPTILTILNTPGMTWGPEWVDGYVSVPGIAGDFPFRFGEMPERWNSSSWGEPKDFQLIARKKLYVVKREKRSTREIVKTSPWLLKNEEFLYVGGSYSEGISVTASGAYGTVDECISNIIIAMLKMVAYQEAERREEAKEMQI